MLQRPIENKEPVEGAHRPREFQVTLRCIERATARARVRKLAEKNKDEVRATFVSLTQSQSSVYALGGASDA